LFNQPILLGASPDDSVIAVREHELNGHEGEVVEDIDRGPARGGDMYGFGFDTKHFGHRGAGEVEV